MTVGRVEVEGLKELRKALKQVDANFPKALQRANKRAAEIVAARARSKVPVRSGRAASTMRATATQTYGAVKFGGAKAPYAAWLDFGGRVGRNNSIVRPYRRSGRYVYPALAEVRPRVIDTYKQAIELLIETAGLK